MKWKDAVEKSKECSRSVPAVAKVTSDREPPPGSEAELICKDKVARGEAPDFCTSGSCPGGDFHDYFP